jgi:histone H3/H4
MVMSESAENLVVVSKLKSYVKNTTGLSTSADVPMVLSQAMKSLIEEAAENAKKDGRKTLMERDFKTATLSLVQKAA